MKQTYTTIAGTQVTVDLRHALAVTGMAGVDQCEILLQGAAGWVTVQAARADVVRDWDRVAP